MYWEDFTSGFTYIPWMFNLKEIFEFKLLTVLKHCVENENLHLKTWSFFLRVLKKELKVLNMTSRMKLKPLVLSFNLKKLESNKRLRMG